MWGRWVAGAFGLIVSIEAGCRRGDLEPAAPHDMPAPTMTTPTDVPPPDATGSGAADCAVAAAEAPLTLATVSDYADVQGLFVDDGAVYFGAWTDGDSSRLEPSKGVLRRVPKDGGDVEDLWSGAGWPLGIATTDEAIFLMTYDYRSRAGVVRMRERDGGAAFAVVGSWSSMGTCGSLTAADGDAFWTDITGSAGSVMHTTAAGITSTLIAGADPCPGLAVARGGQLYWADMSRDILSLPIGGGDARLIWRAFSPQYARQLAITAFAAAPTGDLLFAAFDGRVLRLDPDARTVRTLLAGRPGVVDLAADGSLLYVVDRDRHEIVAVPIDGGTPGTVATGVAFAAAVRVDDHDVYWLDGGQNTVMRAPKCAARMLPSGAAGPPPSSAVASGASASVGDASPCLAPPATVVAGVSDHQLVGPIAVAGDFVYFGASTSRPTTATGPASHAAGALRRAPRAGGLVEEVWTGDGLVRALASDGDALYFVTGWYDGAAEGQAVHVVRANPPHTSWTIAEMHALELEPAIVVENGGVFWTSSTSPNGFNGQVNRADLSGAGATVIASDSTWDVDALALVGDDIYYRGLNGLVRVPQAGGTPTAVSTKTGWPSALAASPAGLFWFDGSGVTGLDLATGTQRQLIGGGVGGYLGVDGLTADRRTVYVASSYIHQVFAVAVTGGDARVVACSPSPVSIASDDEAVYWADQDLMQILRAPKQ
jgi:hypothetical protein